MIDLFFPNLCPSCGSRPVAGASVCNTCEGDIEFLEKLSQCTLCGVPLGYFDTRSSEAKEIFEQSPDSHLCSKCLKDRYSFKSARSITVYGGPVREMLHAFKYEGKLGLAEVLVNTMLEHLPSDLELNKVDVIVPVPLYIGKLRSREYNQSAVLSAKLARRLGLNADLLGLIKIRDTVPQIEIRDEAKRRKNVRGAFRLRDTAPFKGRRVLLIDDVLTTGSTSDECAKTLLKSGALAVDVLTLARARAI